MQSCELDLFPTSLLLECIDSLLPFLMYLISKSLQSGSFHSDFKIAFVKPLLKKHSLDPNQLKNCHSVLNLPFLLKLLGKSCPFSSNRTPEQEQPQVHFSATYYSGHSTETLILHVLNDLVASNSSKVSVLTLSAAFNMIDHHISLDHL